MIFALPSPEPRFDDLVKDSRNIWDEKHGVHFTQKYVYDDTMKLLDIACPACDEPKFSNFDMLSEHVKMVHTKQYCSICAAHKKAFMCELTLYNQKQLQRHLSDGDSDGFSGHPRCKYCRNKRFYSEDELNIHIRDKHERCHICDQVSPTTADYYKNYDHLYEHFRDIHYVCLIQSCVDKRFVVFREDLDLTAHMLKEHGGITGQNGRVVIGSGSSHFLSQLSTFPRRNDQPQEDSLDVKKRRLDERAKHYLNYNAEEFAKFVRVNQSFKTKRITASQLITEYLSIFKDSDRLDISLLVYDLTELYPQHSEQRKYLLLAYGEMIPSPVASPGGAQSFPVLGNGLSRNHSGLSWGAGIGSSKRNQDELFPTLTKPSRSNTPVLKKEPIRYTVIKKQPKTIKTQVNSFQGDSQIKPSYLDSLEKTPSVVSLPILGGGSGPGSSSSSRVQSRSQSPVTRVVPTSSRLDSNFPTLTKKNPRKEIPRVNPVNLSAGGWGLGIPSQAAPKPTEEWGIPIVDKRAEKLKRKEERKKI